MNTVYLELLPHLICLQVTFFLTAYICCPRKKMLPDKGSSPPASSKVRYINTSGFLSSKQSLACSAN